MIHINKHVLVNHSAEAMFALINDVAHYPDFLPWCGGVDVIKSTPDNIVARLHIQFHGLRHAFTTSNTNEPPFRIQMNLVEGPFRDFNGCWQLQALGEQGCKISFDLRYEFSNKLLEKIIGPVFDKIARTFIDAFVLRADQQFGNDK